MDYEKLHKNTLAALQQRVSEGKITEEIARSICADFVKESEDEKIRNWLIDYFNKINDEIELLDRKKIVSWLEKQGEYANFRNKIQIGDEVTRNEDGALVNLSQFKRMVKQGNHKPIKWNSDDLLKRNQIMDILQEYNRPELIAWLEKQGEPRVDMIQWKGDNLREVLEFTGKNKNFDKWFTSFKKFKEYVHEHNDIFKIFNEDGSHYDWCKSGDEQKPTDKVEPKFKKE